MPVARLLVNVLSVTFVVMGGSAPSPSRKIPPPDWAELFEKVPPVTVSGLAPELKMPPPRLVAEFDEKVVLVSVSVPFSSLSMPPPKVAVLLSIVGAGDRQRTLVLDAAAELGRIGLEPWSS